MKKRGLSTVITTLIIVLLVLVSIGIVWAVVINILQENSENISITQFTSLLSIEESATLVRPTDVDITVRRDPGKGDLVGIKFILSDGSNTYSITKNEEIQELQTKTFNLDIYGNLTGRVKEISIVPIISRNGKEIELNIIDNQKIGRKNIDYNGANQFLNGKMEDFEVSCSDPSVTGSCPSAWDYGNAIIGAEENSVVYEGGKSFAWISNSGGAVPWIRQKIPLTPEIKGKRIWVTGRIRSDTIGKEARVRIWFDGADTSPSGGDTDFSYDSSEWTTFLSYYDIPLSGTTNIGIIFRPIKSPATDPEKVYLDDFQMIIAKNKTIVLDFINRL